MTCPTCAAAIFGPAVHGGVSVQKIGERAKEAVKDQPLDVRSKVEILANLANMLAAEAASARDG